MQAHYDKLSRYELEYELSMTYENYVLVRKRICSIKDPKTTRHYLGLQQSLEEHMVFLNDQIEKRELDDTVLDTAI